MFLVYYFLFIERQWYAKGLRCQCKKKYKNTKKCGCKMKKIKKRKHLFAKPFNVMIKSMKCLFFSDYISKTEAVLFRRGILFYMNVACKLCNIPMQRFNLSSKSIV